MDALDALAVLALAAELFLNPFAALYFCGVVTPDFKPSFDVPSCSGIASCSKMAYPYESSYSYYVGLSWQAVNDLRRKLDLIHKACSLDFLDENGNLITDSVNELYNAVNSYHSSISLVVYRTDVANQKALVELSTMVEELNRAGIGESTEPEWIQLYSDMVLSVKDMSEGGTRTELGRIYKELRTLANIQEDISRAESVWTFVRFGSFLVSVGVPRLAGLISLMSDFDQLKKLYESVPLSGIVERYVNLSVGRNNSLLASVRAFRHRLETLKDLSDKRVKELKKDFEEKKSEIDALLEPLREENLSLLASFLPSKTFVGELSVKMSLTPSFAIAKANALERNFLLAYSDYQSRVRYLSALEKMKYYHARLEDLHREVSTYLNTVDTALQGCIALVSSHRFVSDDLKAEAAVNLLIAKDRDKSLSVRVRACSKAYELMEMDRKFKDLVAAYESCKKTYEERWNEELPCSEEDPALALSCCTRESERKLNEFLSDPAYLRYKDLYERIEDVLIQYGLSDLLLELYQLDRIPYNYEELHRSFSKLLSLLEKVKELLASLVAVEWSGYLSAEAISTVELRVKNNLPVSVEGSVSIPFSYYGYEVEGNGMVASVEGKKVKYSGRGSLLVKFQAAPAPYEEEVISQTGGFVEVMRYNENPLPLRIYAPYEVLSLSEGASYKDGYVYLPPGGFVALRIPAVEVEKLVEGEWISFLVRNVSDYSYSGTVELPVRAEEVPSYCVPLPDRVLCKLNLRPGEEKLVKVKGLLLEENRLMFTPPEEDPLPPLVVESPSEEMTDPDVDEHFRELLDRLRDYWERARELNATEVLPFDYDFLRNVEELDRDLWDAALPLLRSVDEQIKSEAEARTKLLEVLAQRSSDPELEKLAAIAKKSLLTGDYIVPLVLSKDIKLGEERESGIDLWLLVALLLSGAVAYVAAKNRDLFKRRKRRIPRF
ncbi:MAG: hypothetical protein GXO00_03360 [Candidatus Diapherotrites archaeon]|nr:hypothetical protein [Candidatus Diapherotrites archaeon]